MQIQYTPYMIPPLVTALISIWVAFYSWQRRTARLASLLMWLAIITTSWLVSYALEIAGTDLPTKLFWVRIEYLSIATIPVVWIIFAIYYSNPDRWLSVSNLLFLFLIPAVTLILVFTTQANGPIWSQINIFRENSFWEWHASYGWWFWVHTAYSYLLIAGGSVIVLIALIRSRGLYRRQAYALLIAAVAPLLGNFLYVFGWSPLNLDATPFAFTVSALAITWGIFGVQLIEILPIARSSIIEEMVEGIIVLDMENRIIDINPAGTRMMGISNSMVGEKITDHIGVWGHLAEKYINVMETTDQITIDRDGTPQWLELRISPIHNKQQRIVGRIITIANVTNRKRTEILLQSSETRYRQLVENANEIIYRTDALGYLTYVNPTALKLMGFKLESDLLGKHFLEFAPPNWRHDLRRFYAQQYFSKEASTYHEFIAVTRQGNEIWLGQNVQIIEENGGIVGFQAVARDVTELKRTQEELAQARDKAIEADRFKSLMLAKVSHELRTPLGGILGYAELLQSAAFGALNDNQEHAISQVIDSTHYLTRIVNDLLDQAQIESKTIRLHSDQFIPQKLLHEIETSMAVLAGQMGLTLATFIAPELPEILYGDEQRLRQILVNLVNNAIKFTKRGEVRVNFSCPDSAHWEMQVSDTGAGIPEEARSYIFEPFRQVDNKITSLNRGTGLGLSICKQLVELMNGQISVESQVGEGSTFTVILPLKKISESIS